MRFIFWLLVLLLLSIALCGQQNVVINTTGAAPDSSAILDIQSQSKGLLIPRMSTAQRLSIVRPAEGLLVFDTEREAFWFYTGEAWREITAGILHQLTDEDTDTYVSVERLPDEDVIRFQTNGEERMIILDDGRAALGTEAPAAGALLELQSENRAFLPPRMNFQQISAIPQPVPGMMAYDTEFACLRLYNGQRWECLRGKTQEDYRPPGDSYGLSAGGAAGDDICWNAAADNEGNVYLAGYYEGNIQLFGAPELSAVGQSDVFLVKLDPRGQALWAVSAGGSSYDRAHGLSLDPAGNVLIAGSFRGTATFGDTTVTGRDDQEIFTASYAPDGQLQWVRTAGGAGQDEAQCVQTDGNGNVYVSGEIWSAATFGDTTITSAGYRDAFLVKYDNDGAFQWAQRFGGEYYETGNGLAVAPDGRIYLGGFFNRDADFAGDTLTSLGESDLYLAALEPNGALRWVRAFGGPEDANCKGLAVDGDGNIYLGGDFEAEMALDGLSVTSRGHYDACLAKVAPDGTPLWALSMGSAGFEEGWRPAIDAQGNIFFTGGFQETADFGPAQLVSSGGIDVFLAKFNPEGNLLWAEKAGGSGMELGTTVAIAPNGALYVVGAFDGVARFGNSTQTSAGGFDVFLWKYVE